MNACVNLQPVDAADVTVLVDNFVDVLMVGSDRVRRAPLRWDSLERDQLLTEHGYSLLLSVHKDGRSESILYDSGLSRAGALHNMDVLGIRPTELRAVVLSHGHADHHGGLEGLIRRLGRRRLPLLLHPDAWRDRKIVFPTGTEVHLPPPSRNDLEREGVEVVEERGPTLLVDGMVLLTGQIPRVTDFEKGPPIQQRRNNGDWEPDPWVWDDQAAVCYVRGKGLVVLSACSHAGAINVLRYAQQLTGIDEVYAFVGGLHLSGGLFEPIIARTINELIAIDPQVVLPGHCTGWKATHELACRLPRAYVQTGVGTCLHLA